jgi:hypothetical protein
MRDMKGQLHCQSCGSTDAENVGWDALARGEGYTACCNEIALVSSEQDYNYRTGKYTDRPVPCSPDRCYHD